VAPHVLNVKSTSKPVVSFMARQLYPWGKFPALALLDLRLSQQCWWR